jgi:DNA-directed RNA polymerase specialized sigma24 family protein
MRRTLLPDQTPDADLLAPDQALARLERDDPVCASLVKLRYFAGLGQGEAAEVLGLHRAHGRPALGVRPRLAL